MNPLGSTNFLRKCSRGLRAFGYSILPLQPQMATGASTRFGTKEKGA